MTLPDVPAVLFDEVGLSLPGGGKLPVALGDFSERLMRERADDAQRFSKIRDVLVQGIESGLPPGPPSPVSASHHSLRRRQQYAPQIRDVGIDELLPDGG
jgi:hypothetical protein